MIELQDNEKDTPDADDPQNTIRQTTPDSSAYSQSPAKSQLKASDVSLLMQQSDGVKSSYKSYGNSFGGDGWRSNRVAAADA